ncbi:flagellar biosynthesis anti-sigma factor FlgM [Pseudomonas sp. NPDC089401]|uniref:flagellar biosynthesis anti-sigma factor FlgM n=1 Tax=Pseudomonas sp. NPDC089401 TaxID=3364462 RepID=UPI003804BFC4
MNITSSPLSSLLPPTDSSLAGTTPSRVAPQDLDGLAEETVQISRLGDLEGSDATADVDLEKVAALRQSIADGSLHTDAEAIYTSLVADIREMAGSEPT